MLEATLETMTEEECIACLRTVGFGRIAVVTADGRPEIFPVNFALRGRTVVIVTASHILEARAPLGHVAFEADQIDPKSRQGWDVVVSGEGADITDTLDDRSLVARHARVDQWATEASDFWISIVNPHFNGRRLYVAAAPPSFF